MNPYRKVRNFHLTYKGHYMLDIPFAADWLGYCYEEANEKHTHVVLRVIKPVSKLELIRELKPYLEIACEIDVAVHKNIETALNYHIGLGDKRRCSDFVMIFPEIDVDDYIKKKVMHKATGINQNRARNEILLSTPTNLCVEQGLIPLEKIILINNCKDEYFKNNEDAREELPDPIPNPWGLHLPNDRDNKKCHYWIWSKESNRGKSTVAGQLVTEFRGILKSGRYDWWTIRKDCDFVVLDEYKGGLEYNDLNALCDGSYEFNVKGKQPFKLENKPIVIIFSNKSIEQVYPNMCHLVASRFNQYELA